MLLSDASRHSGDIRLSINIPHYTYAPLENDALDPLSHRCPTMPHIAWRTSSRCTTVETEDVTMTIMIAKPERATST